MTLTGEKNKKWTPFGSEKVFLCLLFPIINGYEWIKNFENIWSFIEDTYCCGFQLPPKIGIFVSWRIECVYDDCTVFLGSTKLGTTQMLFVFISRWIECNTAVSFDIFFSTGNCINSLLGFNFAKIRIFFFLKSYRFTSTFSAVTKLCAFNQAFRTEGYFRFLLLFFFGLIFGNFKFSERAQINYCAMELNDCVKENRNHKMVCQKKKNKQDTFLCIDLLYISFHLTL